MTREILSDGDIWFADKANAAGLPILDGVDEYGHGAKVIDDWLDDGADQIKANFYNWYNRFKVSIVSGLQVSITSGIVNSGGTRVSIPPQTFTVPNNATTFLWIGKTTVDPTIILRSSTNLPSNVIPLAKVISSAGAITQLQDLRLPAADYLPPDIPNPIPTGSTIITLLPPTVTTIDGYLEILPTAQNISRSVYASLFALYGTYYGAGDGVTTFTVPGHGGRMLKFADSSVGVGGYSGSNQFTLTTNQLPSHSHTIVDVSHNHGSSNSAHSHTTTQLDHTHSATQAAHTHTLYAQQFQSPAGDTDGFISKPSGVAGEDLGSPNQLYNNSIGIPLIGQAQPAIIVGGNQANVSVNPNSISVTINNSNTGITGTQSTGNGQPVNYQSEAMSFRLFVKI